MKVREFRVVSFHDALRKLNVRKSGTLKLCHNTWLVRRSINDIVVQYYKTDIVRYTGDGKIFLDSGGYRTSTTKQRINRCLPKGFELFKKWGKWILCNDVDKPDPLTFVDFVDGMELISSKGEA